MTADCHREAVNGEEFRKLDRDLQILLATNGTLTRILGIVAHDEIVVDVVNQQVHQVAAGRPTWQHLPGSRILQREVLLKGRSSGRRFVAAESLIAVDLLPADITAGLTATDSPIGEIMAASRLETFKEPAEVWTGELPGWLTSAGCQDPRRKTVSRRYRIIAGGQPVMVITEYFLEPCFGIDGCEEPDRWR
jgi:chorismate--pyruvate lyase